MNLKTNATKRRPGYLMAVLASAAALITTQGAFAAGGGAAAGQAAYAMTPATVATAPVSAAPARAATAKVTIVGYAFSPSTLNVTRGTTVTWTNNDSAPHTVTSTGSGPLRSPTLNRGGSYTYTFTSSGTYGYICTIHPSMHGTVVVR